MGDVEVDVGDFIGEVIRCGCYCEIRELEGGGDDDVVEGEGLVGGGGEDVGVGGVRGYVGDGGVEVGGDGGRGVQHVGEDLPVAAGDGHGLLELGC